MTKISFIKKARIPRNRVFFQWIRTSVFKSVFTKDGFDAIIACHEDQITSQLDLQFIILSDYIISAESNRIHYGLN